MASLAVSRAGTHWNAEEEERLLFLFKEQTSIEIIAEIHGRTQGAITSKLKQIAVKYYTTRQKSLQEIERITGVDPRVVLEEVRKRSKSVEPSLDQMIRDIHQRICASPDPGYCYRCGRNTHQKDQCFARIHLNGTSL
jgi:hypothetical protein